MDGAIEKISKYMTSGVSSGGRGNEVKPSLGAHIKREKEGSTE